MRASGLRTVILLAMAAAASPLSPEPSPKEYVQAVEFPYYLYPSSLWERELVWLKSLGIRTVEFSIPWNWHQLPDGGFDLTGRTSPRRDLVGFIRLMRRLGLHAWIRPLPPVAAWPNGGAPPGPANAAAQRAWVRTLEGVLATQTASHGGPVAYIEPAGALSIEGAAPPAPVVTVSAADSNALVRSRSAITSCRGALLWTGVEDELYPAGWEPTPGSLLRKGVEGIGEEERSSPAALRRDAALLRNWAPLLASFHPVTMPRPTAGKLPEGVTAVELTSPALSAVSITNRSPRPFQDELRVQDPGTKRTITIPNVSVAPGESLWLPLAVSLGQKSLCRECSNFSTDENIVYATSELLSIEFENGILAMEFAAPQAGEAILQLERKPVGPFLAGGKPTDFEWDDKTLRARLPIPASKAPDRRMRIGIAIEAPETSAFFNEARRLIVGRKNTVSTSYSSSDVAARSRLRLPEGYTATAKPAESGIDYEVSVPADAVPGDFANLALEADGMPLGRARLELFRAAVIHIGEAIRMHIGPRTELEADPQTAVVEPKNGSNLEVVIRNNWPGIQTFHLEASGDGLEFFPAKHEISIGAMGERSYLLRVFAADGVTGVRDWTLKVTGAATAEMAMRAVLLPRGRTVAWSADLDGDGSPEWILESQKVRAVFSSQDGGRWMEFTSKENGATFLPDPGAFAAAGRIEAKAAGDRIEFEGKGWKRTASLNGATLTIDQTTALPADGLSPLKQGNLELIIQHPAPTTAIYTLR